MLPRAIARRSRLLVPRCSAAMAHPLARALSTSSPPRPPPLPEAQTVTVGDRYALKYIDIRPTSPEGEHGTKKPTFVLIHGAPGSFQDYKYLIPLLQDHARVVAINLPGNGGSQVLDEDHFYERIEALNLAHAAHGALSQLCGDDDDVFVLGHSFGGHATINVTALNQETPTLNIRGIALLASAGLRIHKVLEMSDLGAYHNQLLSKSSEIEAAGREATRDLFTRVWGFPSRTSTEDYVAGLVRCASTDFAVINDHVARIAHIPAFFAWAKDDGYIQDEIFRDLSDACAPGPRFFFRKGGHNIQKTRAEFLAAQLLQWMQRVVAQDGAFTSREISEQP